MVPSEISSVWRRSEPVPESRASIAEAKSNAGKTARKLVEGQAGGLAEHFVLPRISHGSFKQFPLGEAAECPEIDHDFSFTQQW